MEGKRSRSGRKSFCRSQSLPPSFPLLPFDLSLPLAFLPFSSSLSIQLELTLLLLSPTRIQLTRSSASSNLSSLPPLPNPNSSKWISALAPSSTHAHALVQMAPSSQVSQPRYAKQPMGPPPPPPPRAMSRSQTLSSLQPGASSTSNSSSTSTRAELILERFLAEKGLSEEDEREVRELMVKKGRESEGELRQSDG